jgi:hypothetical protein
MKTTPTHTPGTLRAAHILEQATREYGRQAADRVNFADIIDQNTAAPELLEALQLDMTFHSRPFVRDSIEEFRAMGYHGPAASSEMNDFLEGLKQNALAKVTNT